MLFSLRTSAVAAATTPTVACPSYQSQSARPVTETMRSPLMKVSMTSISVTMRISV